MTDTTGDGTLDELFAHPYIDLDELRDEPVRHRYVHGGFEGANTRFSIYLPPPDRYEGRFFQHITPVPDDENLAQSAVGEEDKIGFSIASGAYFLETNGGGTAATIGNSVDPTIGAYRANAAAAQYSRIVAAEMYGEHRAYGYSYGGSGGGYRTIGGAENTTGIWDGFVPYVIGSPMAIPNMFTVRMHAQRVLRHKLDQIVDAIEPGGSGDPYAGLTDEEREALLEVTRMGFPPRSWFGHRTMGMHAFPVLYGGVRMADPTYFEEFWTEPGYLGADPTPSLVHDRVELPCEVVALLTGGGEAAKEHMPQQIRGGVDTAWKGAPEEDAIPTGVRLSASVAEHVMGAELLVRSGPAAGARLGLLTVEGDIATFGPGEIDARVELRPGDQVEVSNLGYLAAQTYHRHQVPSAEYPVWDQFREADGSPTYPQRPLLLGPLFAAGASGTVQTGRFAGKMIVVAVLLDREAVPWQADWYRARVQEHLGDAADDHFRLWYVDNAVHGDAAKQESPIHTISYVTALQQALRDLSRWVEQGIEPPATTNYEVVDGQVVVPSDARSRRGVQPVVTVTADGGERADVAAGAEVTLRAVAEMPEGAGAIVAVEWDLDGSGRFAVQEAVEAGARVVVERRHAFTAPGTWFPTVRVAGQRDGDPATPYARLRNLARCRVVVGPPAA